MKRFYRMVHTVLICTLFLGLTLFGGIYLLIYINAERKSMLVFEYTQEFLIARKELDIAVQENLLLLEQVFRSNTLEICLPDPLLVLSAAKKVEQKLQMIKKIATKGYQYESILSLSNVSRIKDYLSAIKAADLLLEEIQQIEKEYKMDLGICFLRPLPGEPT